ncbi:MAG: XRE family transcriptional regulator [Oscillospiraceae bacterium]|jgi:mannose-6-phosphate isomerase-like protein (cupin superfamily)/DNA-binding XRE family transcriptional regulator|nr:XRE family transcriptional regulator [Oscillospiraceae bacterium]
MVDYCSSSVSDIARRIRELRGICDYTPEEMAEECAVAPDEYASYESGEADMPISFLLRLAERFHVDMTEMITGETPRLSVYCVTRAGKGVDTERREHYSYRNLAFNFLRRKVEPLHVVVKVGANRDLIQSAHEGQEFDYVLSGLLRLRIDDKDVTLRPGDSVYFDSSHPHALQAAGGEDVNMLAIVIP